MASSNTVNYTRYRLKIALMQRGLKQAYIAKSMGKDQAWVSKIVNGWIDPSDEDMARLASVLDVGLGDVREMFSSVA